jgi:hypothetical protein
MFLNHWHRLVRLHHPNLDEWGARGAWVSPRSEKESDIDIAITIEMPFLVLQLWINYAKKDFP